MTNEEMKDRVLANFRKTVAEMEQATGELYLQKQWRAIGLLAALNECGLTSDAEHNKLLLDAHYVS
ncbi:hypothetical protein [Pseudomonas syringae group sp. J254-4]|uniref:hypothetical protein n=1 Tax=Pseudomonas syringae group sp. J254-4 TaxID=3079589 RepID=UPI002913A9E1|nr:hypothetical protein [Pseudomonas syringae group sp. J254-4]MDU8456764.1 hypothetical protein [Pseudomonas syringae group sp. J254-4]